jgi:hypothetical protein
MELGTVGWLVLGWFAVALIISFALGGFLKQTSANMGETDLAEGISKQQVVRYMRGRKPKLALASSSARTQSKRIVG